MISAAEQGLLAEAATIMLAAAVVTFVVSELTRNYSQVDRLWSLMPVVYAWLFAGRGGWDVRVVLMALLVTASGLPGYDAYRGRCPHFCRIPGVAAHHRDPPVRI